MSSILTGDWTAPFVARTLVRRSRPDNVAAELALLTEHSSSIVLKWVTETDKEKQLSRECLVAVLRTFVQQGNQDGANAVFMALVERISGALANKLALWSSIPKQQLEDVRQSLLIGIYEFLYSLDQSEELWECNFKTCFDTRLLNIIGRLTRGNILTVSASQVADDDATFEQFEAADPHAQTNFESIEVEEALNYLDGIDSRLGRSFYLKFFVELPEREIADLMEVSERTVRNWIATARKLLRQFYSEH